MFQIRRSVAVATLAVAAAVLAPASPAAAQEAVKVERIVFEGNRRYSEATLEYSMRTKEGEPLDEELLARDISMLRTFFETITVVREPVAGGVRLVFRVTENPVVSRVEFLGLSDLTEGELRPLVETRGGYPLAAFRLENDVRILEQRYRDAGYHFVEIRPETLEEEGARRVVFRVVEGPRVLVEEVRFEGVRAVPAGKLEGVMVNRPSGFLSPRPFVERRLEEDRVAVARYYRDEGFLEARVFVKGVEFNDDRDEAAVTLAVEEGEPWSVGEVQVTGGTSLTDRARVASRADRVVPGQRWNRRDIDRVVRAMEDEAKRQGFSDVRVGVEPIPRAEGRVQDLRFVVREGRRITLRSIEVSGNTLTRDKVILREFTLAPGDPLDSNAVEKAVQRVLGTQYFTSVIPVYKDADPPDRKDVEIQVEESPRMRQIRFGFGVSSDSGLFGAMDITFRNFDVADAPSSFGEFWEGRAFSGAGQTLQITLQPGTEVSSYRLAFTEPWVMDRPLLFGFDLEAKRSRRFRYDEDRLAASLLLQRRWLLAGEDLDDVYTIGLGPRIESVDISRIDDDAPPNAFDIEGRNSVHALAATFGWKRLDRPFEAERGWQVALTTELAGTALGGDFEFHRHSVQASRVYTLWKNPDERAHTLTLRAGAGFAGPLGDDPVPLVERFFAGGASGIGQVRGFEYGGVGPHGRGDRTVSPDKVARSVRNNDGDPMGGEAVASGTVEYGFPLYSDLLRGAVFVDAGNLAENTGGLKRDWRSSAGFGILIRVPIFQVPLRFDFGFPIGKERGDDTQVVSFEFTGYF